MSLSIAAGTSGPIPLAKAANRLHPHAMPFLCTCWKSILIQGHRGIAGIDHLNHQSRIMNRPADNSPLLLRQLFTGMNGILQSIGKHKGQPCFIHRQLLRKGQMGLHLNVLLLCLFKVGRKHGVEHRRRAPLLLFCLFQMLRCRRYVFQHLSVSARLFSMGEFH